MSVMSAVPKFDAFLGRGMGLGWVEARTLGLVLTLLADAEGNDAEVVALGLAPARLGSCSAASMALAISAAAWSAESSRWLGAMVVVVVVVEGAVVAIDANEDVDKADMALEDLLPHPEARAGVRVDAS